MKYLSWDDDSYKKLISTTIHEWYDAKFKENPKEEIEVINYVSIKVFPGCESLSIVKNDIYNYFYNKYIKMQRGQV